MSYTKKVLIDYAKSYGVREKDIVEYAKNFKGCASKQTLLTMAKDVEMFRQSDDKTKSVEAYSKAVAVLGILYAACDKLGLEGGDLLDRETKRTLIYSTLGFVAFISLIFALLFGNRILTICEEGGKQAIKETGYSVRALARSAANTSENLGTQAIAWTGFVAIVAAVTAVVIFKK